MDEQVEKLLTHYPVRICMPVRWGDMDAFNHVNNVVYLRYFECARIAYFERLEVGEFSPRSGIGPILASTSCKYKFPLTYPDTISIGARCVAVGEDRFTQQYRVVSHRHGRLAAEGDGIVVSYDYRQQCKVPIPAQVRRAIALIEQGG